jgi:hypothetical protein
VVVVVVVVVLVVVVRICNSHARTETKSMGLERERSQERIHDVGKVDMNNVEPKEQRHSWCRPITISFYLTNNDCQRAEADVVICAISHVSRMMR